MKKKRADGITMFGIAPDLQNSWDQKPSGNLDNLRNSMISAFKAPSRTDEPLPGASYAHFEFSPHVGHLLFRGAKLWVHASIQQARPDRRNRFNFERTGLSIFSAKMSRGRVRSRGKS